MRTFVCCALIMTLASASSAGIPTPPYDDNGHHSFVRQVVPKLLGRKPRGTEEVKLLSDIAALQGREAVVRMLMEENEFETHWTALLIDHLKVQREFGLAQSNSCYGGPMSTEASEAAKATASENLADFVRDSAIQSSYQREFNMYELIRDSIRVDNVFPAYRAHLYALGHKVGAGNSMISAEEQRAIVGAEFDDVYLGRDLECMTCHNSKAAVTDYKGNHQPLYRGLDYPMYDHIQTPVDPIQLDLFETTCAGCHGATAEGGAVKVDILGASTQMIMAAAGSGAMAAIVLTQQEAQALEDALVDPRPFSSGNVAETAAKHFAAFRRDFFRPKRFCEDETTACTRDSDCDDIGDEVCRAEEVGWGPWGISTDCAAIWNESYEGPLPAFFAGLSSNYATVSDVDDSFVAGYEQLPNAPAITGDTSFAYMVAAKVTENVWKQLMGEPLTLVNRYARNEDQRDTHQHLTENVFIENGWSLKELIVAILGERYFNRRAPAASYVSDSYALPAMWDPFAPENQTCRDDEPPKDIDDLVIPWQREEPTGTPYVGTTTYATTTTRDDDLVIGTLVRNDDPLCAFNGQGELVHRYAPRVLLNSVGSALDWPAPEIFPQTAYPSDELQRSIGQYLSAIDPGTKNLDFQSLLYWDDAHGRCDKESIDEDPDWINTLIGEIDVFNAANPEDPLTLRDVVLTLKDWLLQEPTLGGYTTRTEGFVGPKTITSVPVEPSATEGTAVEDLFGRSLEDPVTTDDISETDLRDLCGAYLRAPQFMLAGLVRPEEFDSPRLRVCTANPCSYREMCESYRPSLLKVHSPVECKNDGVEEPLPLQINPNPTPDPNPDPGDLTSLPIDTCFDGVDTNGNGLDDDCECGDPNGSGGHESDDLFKAFDCLRTDPEALGTTCSSRVRNGDTNNSGQWDSADLFSIFNAIGNPDRALSLTCPARPDSLTTQ